MTEVFHSLDLVVTEGVQRGARFSLQNRVPTTIGVRLDCDVVLEPQYLIGDESFASGQEPVLRLLRDGPAASVDVLGGEVFLNQQKLPADVSSRLLPGQHVKVGHSVFTLEEVPINEPAPAVTGEAATSIQSFMQSTDSAQGLLGVNAKKRPVVPRLALACCAVLGLLFVVAGVAEYAGFTEKKIMEEKALPDFAALLPAAEFDDITFTKSSDDSVVIQGFVTSRAQLTQLKNLVEQYTDRIAMNVSVGEDLQDSILSIYRLHGVEAEVELRKLGHASIRTAVSDESVLDGIEERVKRDIPGLLDLARINVPPLAVVEKPAPEPMPGKRIVLVVASEPAYILTEDGSRYFPGSVLPNGYRIQAIHNQKVDLVRNEEHLELIF